MKRKNLTTVIITLLFVVFALGVKAQGTLRFDGTYGTAHALTDVETNVLFGYSGFSVNNVLVLNGVPVINDDSGWFTDLGYHDTGNKNYACGLATEGSGDYYRNFFVFDLTDLASLGITPPITSAVLRVDRYVSVPNTGSQIWELFTVTTPGSSLGMDYDGTAGGINIFNDLGSGDLIGSVPVDRSLSYSPQVEVTLNSTGLTAINSSIGEYFVIGGKADSIKPVPVPIWIIAIGFLLMAGVVFLRFRRKRQLA